MDEIKVTIVIPTYKRPDRIERAVLSALKQSWPNKEVIVVDDNGKESAYAIKTKEALQDYIDRKDIQYIQNEVNRGGSFTRNVGLQASTGKYITFLDDDDEIHPQKLEKQILCLEEKGEDYSACYTGYHKLQEKGNQMTSDETMEGDVYPYALARAIYVGSGSNLLVRTKNAKAIGGYDPSFKRNQDLEFMARILKDHKLAYVDEDLLTIHYEIRENTYTYNQMVDIDTFFLEKFKDEISQLDKATQQKIYSTVALERWRYSLSRKSSKDAQKNLKQVGVSKGMFVKYILYLIDRVVRKKSYGFKA